MDEFKCPNCGITLTVKVKERPIKTLEDIRNMFPHDLSGMLSFEEETDYFVVRPRQFLGTENFSKIAAIIRTTGGDYISAGKNSHFRIQKQ
ncbi:MAG: hypothetical protein PVH12_04500 [Candidatus Bathyarchaeota archaeon]|jgi:hypothetical protein